MKHIEKLLDIMATLRNPESGCPWDREQDFASIAPYTIEEAYEVADAIDRGDTAALRGELGDLLFQVVFHARMAQELGQFDFDDVAAGICDKLVRRHPHVFGDAAERAAGQQAGSWERIKAEERAAGGDASALAGVPMALPALSRAQKLGRRAAAVGFDWRDRLGVQDKIAEELGELEDAVGSRDAARIDEELGDLLFTIVNLARHVGADAEQALAAANRKFERRFREMEASLVAAGRPLDKETQETLDREWRAAKRRLGGAGSGS